MTIRSALSKLLTATIVLLLLVVVPLASVEAAGTIFVRPDGDDTNCDGTADVAYPGSGGPGLACAVKTIQKGVDLVDTGGTVTVAAGIYVENVVVAKAATISGAGAATTTVYPAVSNPACAGSLCGSNIFLVQSSDVAIRGFTLDGDNPAIVSGIVVGGADIDARNGIIQNHALGVPYNNMEVAELIVQNIYFRGIYASSGGAGFDIHDNLVQNVRGDSAQGNAIMNWAGSGMIQDNTIMDASDGIVSNHSSGTQYLHNTIRNTPVGIHTDNNGTYGGIGDVIHGNVIEDCSTNGYGLFVFASRLNNSVDGNTITNCSVGMAMAGQYAVVTTTFSNNVLDGENLAGATGIYETTAIWGYGSGNVSAIFTNNVVTNYETATYFETDPTYTLSATFLHNSITNYTDGVFAVGTGTYSVNGTCNWWGGLAGMTTSDPIETGMTFKPWLVYGTDGNSTDIGFQLPANFSVTPPGDVSAAENDFTVLQNAVACAVDGQTIDLSGSFDWTATNALLGYTDSYQDSATVDLRGAMIPSGVDNLTITSLLEDATITGAGDIVDGIYDSFLFTDDAAAVPGNTNLTISNLAVFDFENAFMFGWNATGIFDGTLIDNNNIELAGDDESTQNIAIYFWRGIGQSITNNVITLRTDGTDSTRAASFGFQNATSGGTAYDGLQIDSNIIQVSDSIPTTALTFGIWENSHSDPDTADIAITNNQFLGNSGDQFDRALLLSSQSDGLVISGNTFDYVDNVYYVGPGQGPTAGDSFSFSGNMLTNVGGPDGIFLQNFSPYRATPLSPEVTVQIQWNLDNSIDGETGIRGLNELSIEATHASRASSAATDIDAVTGIPVPAAVFVDDTWVGEGRFVDPDGIGLGDELAFAYNAFDTIQGGVDAVTPGGVVNVAAGTYQENIVVNKIVSILGAGSGNTGSDTIVTSPVTVDYKVGVFQITASGNSGAIILLSDMQVHPVGQAGVSIGRFTESTGTSVAYLTLDNLFVIGTNNNAQTEQERGLYVDLTSTLDHLTIVDSAFNNLAYGWYFQKAVSADTSTVSNVTVTNTLFNHNNLKGLYTEKLTEASFIDCTISENGFSATGLPSYFIPWMAGVDLNLKAGSYQNIAFIDSVFSNNALGGAQHGVGLTIKARDDGATYGAFPATLDGVMISGGNFVGNERGIRIGEPGKNNAGPTNVTILLNRIFANEQTYIGTDGSAYGGIINQSLAAVAAENNWWGCNEGPTTDGSTDCDLLYGTVDANPWLTLENVTAPTAIDLTETSTSNSRLIKNSDGVDTDTFGYVIDGIEMTYSGENGTMAPPSVGTLNGLTSSVYTPTSAPEAAGMNDVCVDLDNEQICTSIDVAMDEATALAWVQANTTLTGDLAELTATFPTSIPPVLVDLPYTINSRMTLGQALPAGSTVTIEAVVGGVHYPYITNALIPGTTFWITELFDPDAIPADFDAGYGGHVEIYSITLNYGDGNPLAIDTTVLVESIISKDGFVTPVILADITLPIHVDADEAAALVWTQENTTLTGTLAALTATFPTSIPPVIVAEPYTINSRMTLGQALPAGTTVSIMLSLDGGAPFPYVTDVLVPGTTFWITDIAGGTAADFDAGYGGHVELYSISITNGGGNPLAIDTTVLIESIISKDGFVTPVVLADISLPIHLDADEAAALAWLQANMDLSGTSLASVTATFPPSIPPVIVDLPYTINSRMTLGQALPAGTTVTIMATVDGVGPFPYVTDALIPGTTFWITDLAGGTAANFDASYGGHVEIYSISITNGGGNPLAIDTTVLIESIISKDNFVTPVVLDSLSLPVHLDADEAAALAWLQANMDLSGTSLASVTATFPPSIPPVIVDLPYTINSRMTLGQALPAGTTVTIMATVDGVGPFPYVTDALIPGTTFWITDLAGGTAANFDAGYGGHVEIYSISITNGGGNPLAIDTTVLIESIISKDNFVTPVVLDSLSLPVHLDADEAAALAWVQTNTTLTGTLASLTAIFPTSIPPVIVAEPYTINSRMTLGQALPAGTTVSIMLSLDGGAPFPYVTDVLVPGTTFWITDIAGGTAANFDEGYGGHVELYSITITSGGENPIAIDTTVLIESIISKDGFVTPVVLADISLPIHLDADVNSTTTTVDCGSGTPEVTYGGAISCVATVTAEYGTAAPDGTVTWMTDGSGAFTTTPCTLSGAAGVSTCSVSYTPDMVGDGSHLISATYGGSADFAGSSGNQLVTVNPRSITVTADAQSKVYGDTDPTLTYQVTSGSLAFTDAFTGDLDRADGEDVSTYAINQGTLALASNYTLTYVGADLTITARPVEVTADAMSKTYGDADPTLTYAITVGSLAFSDDFTGTLERVTGETVAGSPYAISQGSLSLGTNYTLTFVGADLSITKRAITVTADAMSKLIGTADPTFTYSITAGSLAFSDAFTGALDRDPGETAGTYAITIGSLALTEDYEITFVGDLLTIYPYRFFLPAVVRP